MSDQRGNRRDFLKWGVGASAGLGLAGCSTLDRIVLGDQSEDADRIVILGAGAAGLAAAYQLKKQNLPYHVYEASARIGGRIYTIPDFFRGQTVAELGAEFFTGEQKFVLDLAKELRIETTEVAEIETRARRRRLNQILPLAGANAELKRLQKSAARAEVVTGLSLADWAKARSRDAAFTSLISEWSLERYGAAPELIAAEVFAPAFDRAKNPVSLWTESRYRFRAGSNALAQAMFDRTAGFQPERTYSFRHKLIAVRRRSRGLDLVFETPSGQKSVFARHVICALPLAVLKDVDGLIEFSGPWTNASAFQVGAHSKFIYSYQERFWGTALDQSKLIDFGEGQVVWESSYRLNPLFQFRQGVLSVLWGGEAAKAAGPQHRLAIQRELESLFRKKATGELMEQAMVNWSLQPFAKGSVSYPRPGMGSEWQETSEDWVWAGEHTVGLERGTLQGALVSGVRAAEYLIQNRPQRLFPL
ncbi:MAG: FAD-dependent oxidoreductase [Bdellovibrionaceae bacterium]|nr:FAD-dependent oxidoreductase [Pseudobdellovibrionaceae bacterium]